MGEGNASVRGAPILPGIGRVRIVTGRPARVGMRFDRGRREGEEFGRCPSPLAGAVRICYHVRFWPGVAMRTRRGSDGGSHGEE